VAIIESEANLGGAWSLGGYDFRNQKVIHETACHLIEWYQSGYEFLAEISRVPFEVCDPQPVKVWSDGKVEPYTTRSGVALEYLRTVRSIFFSAAKIALSSLGIRYKRSEALYQLAHCVERLRFESRYKLPAIFKYDGIRLPQGGYGSFVCALGEQIQQSGIIVLNGKAVDVALSADNQSSVRLADGRIISGRDVVLGESSDIAQLDSAPHANNHFSNYHHVLVSLPASDTQIRNSYVHFPNHPVFHRITYVEDLVDAEGQGVAIFLLQLRMPLTEEIDLRDELDKATQHYRIAHSFVGLSVLKLINAAYVSSSFDSGWRLRNAKVPKVLRTIGDLSRSALINRAAVSPKR
jgi:hypothetical protein